jgi:hypothetical protein
MNKMGKCAAHHLPYRRHEFRNVYIRKTFLITGLAKCTNIQALLMKEE